LYLATRDETYSLDNVGWGREVNLQLPPFTLVYGEYASRIRKGGRGEIVTTDKIFYVIDAGILNERDISEMDVLAR